jgi:hypothetical protein
MSDNENFQQPDAPSLIDQKLAEAIEAVDQLEYLIREGFKDTDAKIKMLNDQHRRSE